MFDAKSDFALNKFHRDAIVCKDVTGLHIRLTCADFSSEEDFLRWKLWSNGDFYDTEKDRCSFCDNDNGIPLGPCVNKLGAIPSIEAEILSMMDAAKVRAEQARKSVALIEQPKSCLTKTQYCHL